MYNILSLDGGGCWSALQAMALQALFSPETTGHEVLSQFDLVAANSGGSLVLGGLIENMSLADLNALFLDRANREKVFARPSSLLHLEYVVLRLLGLGWKYSTRGKLRGIEALMPTCARTKLSALPPTLSTGARWPATLICGFDFDQARGVLFRSNQASPAASFSRVADPLVTQAIHASSNAPVAYFDAPARFDERQFWDGGVAGYNNPVLVAVIEALAGGASEIRALSIGTGTVSLPFSKAQGLDGLVRRRERSAPVADVRRLAEAIIDDPPDAASFQAHVILGGPLPRAEGDRPSASPVVRMSPLVQPVPAGEGWEPPPGFTRESFMALCNTPIDAVDQTEFDLIEQLGRAWIANQVANQPVRVNRTTLACEIGYPTFTEAAKAYDPMRRAWVADRALARAS